MALIGLYDRGAQTAVDTQYICRVSVFIIKPALKILTLAHCGYLVTWMSVARQRVTGI